MKKESLLYDRLKNNRVRCNICQRRCIIAQDKLGYCTTRLNEVGKLYTLIYGEVSTWMISPAELKPIFHFYPGSKWLSLGSIGCNFRCPGCQNWDIAHYKFLSADRQDKSLLSLRGAKRRSNQNTNYISPEDGLKIADKYNCLGISWTYNEPTVWFEYTLDFAKLAKASGFYTNYVTNGFITPEALDVIGPWLDVFRVDIKGFSNKFYKKLANISEFNGILEVTELAKHKWNMWVEVVTNVIPGYNDDIETFHRIADWIKQTLGPDTPWHITRFIPHCELQHISYTPIKTLENAREIGVSKGLKFVYIGNVTGHPYENTYCPNCKKMLIKRHNYVIEFNYVENGRCKYCGEPIPVCDLGNRV
ncbi:MAG: AmmeMemoRadiSam system radical SAM enzyme [bacterium]|nr:AmmeMemoRadiSam system radical SAM enzyme [bacterium]